MALAPPRRSLNLTSNPSTLIPNYEMIHDDLKIPRIDGSAEFSKLFFLHDSKYKVLQETMPLPEKRILNVPHKKINNWNNYIVHSMHCDYLESWRDHLKIPENWIGPEPQKP